jgi:hypothetical protein
VVEVAVIGHLVWFYEKAEVGWANTNTKLKTWGKNQQSLEGLLDTL